MKSILQDWVMRLGLRHQGVLVSAVRGCDDEPRNSPTKILTRCLRDAILEAHCGDNAKAATFMERVSDEELLRRMDMVRKDMDHLPHHFVMHMIHAVEIIGYKHPNQHVAGLWRQFYERLVRCLHLRPETEDALDERLNRDEASFAQEAMRTNGLPSGSRVSIDSNA